MVNSYYGVYQAERGKTTGEIRAAGRVPGRTGRRMRADHPTVKPRCRSRRRTGNKR